VPAPSIAFVFAGSLLLSPQTARLAYRYWVPTATAFFVNGGIFGGWAAQVPHAVARLDADEGTFGLMLLGMGIGSVAAMAFSGRLIARRGASILIRLSLVVFLATYVVLCTTSDWALFIGALLLFGAGGGLMDVAMNAYAADVERHMDWRVMASFHGMWSVGGLVGAAAASYLLSVTSDLAQALVLDAALAILFLACQHNLVLLPHPERLESSRRWAIGRLTLVIAVLTALCFAAEGAVRDWSSLFLTREIGSSIERASWGFAAFSATMALCRLSGDWLRLRFGERTVIVASGLLAVLGFVLAVAPAGDLSAAAGFGVVGVGLSNVVPILISAAGRTRSPGSSIAFVVSFGYAGYLASPPALGFIASHSSLATMFLVVAAACVAIPAGWMLVERTRADA
jgi:MFS family permease